jgi:hypothetical protein
MKKTGSSSEKTEDTEDFKQKFAELPLNQKLATLMQLEMSTMSEAVNTIVDKSISAGENVMDMLSNRTRQSKGGDSK